MWPILGLIVCIISGMLLWGLSAMVADWAAMRVAGSDPERALSSAFRRYRFTTLMLGAFVCVCICAALIPSERYETVDRLIFGFILSPICASAILIARWAVFSVTASRLLWVFLETGKRIEDAILRERMRRFVWRYEWAFRWIAGLSKRRVEPIITFLQPA